MTFEEKISLISIGLKNPLPGEKQQLLMSPAFRALPDLPPPLKKAAVMICIIPGEKDLQTIFIKRNEYDGPHSGQISFPGGIYEEKDIELSETALRETKEEIGIDCSRTALLGALTPLLIPVSNVLVYPFVGYYGNSPMFTLDKREVDYLIIPQIADLLNPGCIKKEKWNLRGMDIEVPFYLINENIIWGATAMILSEFLEIISRSGLYKPYPYSGNDRSET